MTSRPERRNARFARAARFGAHFVGAVGFLLGCAAGCRQAPETRPSAISVEERKNFSVAIILSERRLVGTLVEIQEDTRATPTLSIQNAGQIVEVRLGGARDSILAAESARIRGLIGNEVAIGLHRVHDYEPVAWALKWFEQRACIRRNADVRDILASVESLDHQSDWYAKALGGERGYWDSYLHNHDSEQHSHLKSILMIHERSELRVDMIGWLCRNHLQPDVPWAFSEVSLGWPPVSVRHIRDLTILVLENLYGLRDPSLRIGNGPWGYFDLSRRLWMIESVLTQQAH
ncbi:MAG: hypothetical protein AB7T19_20645 [Planctomycetota bacterium]